MTRTSIAKFITILVLLVMPISGCNDSPVEVDFSKTVEQAAPDNKNKIQPIKVAIAAMISPQETLKTYQHLLQYLGESIGRPLKLVQRKTYGEVNVMLGNGKVDMAFICSGPYVTGKDIYGFIPMATPIVRGEPFYRAYLIVNENCLATSFDDMRGSSFAFTDPDSNTGALVPLSWLRDLGESPQTFFSKTIHTYSHDNSILAVAKGMVDGATVDGHIWEHYNTNSPAHTQRTKVIQKSAPYGNPPIVASPFMEKQEREELQKILLTMHEDPEALAIIKQLAIDQFVVPKDEWYKRIEVHSPRRNQ